MNVREMIRTASTWSLMLLPADGSPTVKAQQISSSTPTIRATSRLVFMDVTVLDKHGQPVIEGLTKDDFTITEDKKPERIFSFEPPERHIVSDTAEGEIPLTIFVLDQLNSKFEDFSYVRHSMRKYLDAQPAVMRSPCELMVLDNQKLSVVKSFTRDKAALLSAVERVPVVAPTKMSIDFRSERFVLSLDALQQVALQNRGVTGRKNIVWIGPGAPGVPLDILKPSDIDWVRRFVHDTTNMLVEDRISLFLIHPGISNPVVRDLRSIMRDRPPDTTLDLDNPFAGDINFANFVKATGGHLFYNRNDVDAEIGQAETWGSTYYTLTYQPAEGDLKGEFRHIHVTLRDPSLQVVTKSGYYAPEKQTPVDTETRAIEHIAQAASSPVSFGSLQMTADHLVRHPDTRTVEFTVRLKSRNLSWQGTEAGKSQTYLRMAVASLNGRREFLKSKMELKTATAKTKDTVWLSNAEIGWPMTIAVPRETRTVRVVIENVDSGRIGSVEIDRKAIDAAPEAPTPETRLLQRPTN